MTKSVLSALFCCLILRWSAAWITQHHPIFPSYYYTDAVETDKTARQIVENWKIGYRPLPPGTPGTRLYLAWVSSLYYVFGYHPLLPKLLNGLIATVAVYAWYLIARLLLGAGAWMVPWLLSLWPSHVFFSSQNLKDSFVLLSSALALYFPLALWHEARSPRPALRDHARATAGGGALLFTGFMRPPILLMISATLLACAALVPARSRRGFPVSARLRALTLLWTLGVLAAFRPVSSLVFDRWLATAPLYRTDSATRVILLPATVDPEDSSQVVRPFTPQGLTQFRRIRHSEDQKWSRRFNERVIQTQIFPEARFHTWLDVAIFLPKGMLYALFMPLPGFYPLSHSLGRLLAALENAALLALFLLAGVGWARSRGYAPWVLGSFFLFTGMAYGLFEFDLGAATRHRLQYFPCLFPFAAATLLAWRQGPERVQAD